MCIRDSDNALTVRDEGDRMELPTKRVKEGVSCRALLSLESLLKKLKSNPFKARLVRLPVIEDVYKRQP